MTLMDIKNTRKRDTTMRERISCIEIILLSKGIDNTYLRHIIAKKIHMFFKYSDMFDVNCDLYGDIEGCKDVVIRTH